MRGRGRDVVLGLILFGLALLPRVLALGQILTPDENLWINRSIGFLDAISRGDWAASFQVGHPGVTTRWTGIMGMVARYWPNVAWTNGEIRLGPWALAEMPNHLLDVLAAVRLPTVLLFSMLVVAVFFMIRRLLGPGVALLAAILLALDPFGLAISRVIHHDALNTIFMTTSLLAFALWLEAERRRWLVLSAALGGLAALSKSTGLYLGPAIALTALIYYVGRRRPIHWKRLIVGGIVWVLIFGTVCFAVWPAMWVDPLGTVRGVIDKAMGYAASPHERDNFFLGQLRPDPGVLFYPIATAFRLTPLSLLGALASLGSLAAAWWGLRREDDPARRSRAVWLLAFWVFVVGFTAFMTLGAKKFDRYLLPVFPFLDVLAAVGLTGLGSWAARRLRISKSARWGAVALLAALVLQAASSLPTYPYYLSAYNPLLGGAPVAAKVLLIGWGEGYDQVADYLNAQPGAEKLNVATWYAKQTMGYQFRGRSWDIRADSQETIGVMPWTQADYVVVYINQLQRQIPDARSLAFFASLTPERVVNLSGLDYAWIYRVPKSLPPNISPFQYPTQRDFGGGKVRLLGYDIDDGLTSFEGNQYAVMTLYWQCLQAPAENYRLYLKLVNGAYDVWGEQESYPIWDSFMTADWKPGVIIRDVHGIMVKPGTPPGEYQVAVDWLEPYLKKALLPDDGKALVVGPVRIPTQPAPKIESLDMQHPVGADFGRQVRLLGYSQEGDYRPGGEVRLTLFWQAMAQPDRDYTVFNHLVGPTGALAGQKDNAPVTGFYPTSRWKKGEIVRDYYRLPIARDATPGAYHIETGLYASDSGERLPVSNPPGDRVTLTGITIQP
jgi:4-amino-4-deoxy-L-arabinose transferase-like glycosyltransferase